MTLSSIINYVMYREKIYETPWLRVTGLVFVGLSLAAGERIWKCDAKRTIMTLNYCRVYFTALLGCLPCGIAISVF